MKGVTSDQSRQESSGEEEIEGSDINKSLMKIKQKAFDELARLGDEMIIESDGEREEHFRDEVHEGRHGPASSDSESRSQHGDRQGCRKRRRD